VPRNGFDSAPFAPIDSADFPAWCAGSAESRHHNKRKIGEPFALSPNKLEASRRGHEEVSNDQIKGFRADTFCSIRPASRLDDGMAVTRLE